MDEVFIPYSYVGFKVLSKSLKKKSYTKKWKIIYKKTKNIIKNGVSTNYLPANLKIYLAWTSIHIPALGEGRWGGTFFNENVREHSHIGMGTV